MKELLLITSMFLASYYQSSLKRTIILINGDPHLVVIDDRGNLVETIQAVPYYFASDLTHEEIVAGLSRQLKDENSVFYANNEDRFVSKDEIDVAENVELIQFLPQKALLNREAVNRIRQIANEYRKGGIDKISLSIIQKSTNVSRLLTENRMNSVKDLMVAFGVDSTDLLTSIDRREGYDDNPFVRVSYKKRL